MNQKTFLVEVDGKKVSVNIEKDAWEIAETPAEASKTNEPIEEAQPKTKSILKSPDGTSNGAMLRKLVNDAKQKITALDAEMASQRTAFMTQRREEMDSKIDPLLSDEAAKELAGANFVTARKEAMAKFPSSAESDSLKSALAEYEAKAAELVEIETKLKDLIDSAAGLGGLGGSDGASSKSAGKRKRGASSSSDA